MDKKINIVGLLVIISKMRHQWGRLVGLYLRKSLSLRNNRVNTAFTSLYMQLNCFILYISILLTIDNCLQLVSWTVMLS